MASAFRLFDKNGDNAINAAVIMYDTKSPDGRRCFDGCSSADLVNTSSICFVTCFYQTVLGPQSAHSKNTTGGMPMEDLDNAWRAPFASDDPSKGGCPEIP